MVEGKSWPQNEDSIFFFVGRQLVTKQLKKCINIYNPKDKPSCNNNSTIAYIAFQYMMICQNYFLLVFSFKILL